MVVQILPIRGSSDGDGRKWPKHHYERNDAYFLERIATDKWIKDLPGGPQPGVTYRLDRLPHGYAGFQRQRPDSMHIDRYIYGHPRGQFRSLNEFYPHFKHLMDTGGAAGCTCKLCSNVPRATKQKTTNVASGYDTGDLSSEPRVQRKKAVASASDSQRAKSNTRKPVRVRSESPQGVKRKLADREGTTDVYESMINKLREAGSEASVDLPLDERASPDWWTGHVATINTIKSWQQLPRYVPRCGEVVLFARSHQRGEESIRWEQSSQGFKRLGISSNVWLGQPNWQAGVVTQLPDEPISVGDLLDDSRKEHAVNYSGFRIEPLSEPGNDRKPWTKQSQYVPLHVIRPLTLLSECLNGVPQAEWHPTIEHALRIASSFCIVGRYRFRGTWPNATIFAMGVYLGPELILVGDVVRLLPRPQEQTMDTVTDVMVVTAIRLRFVNLFLEDDKEHVPIFPYHTCLHFSGRVYTQDPRRCFDGVGRSPINSASDTLPRGLSKYGAWYHYTDPAQPEARIEVPFSRVLGRCVEDEAMSAWFTPPEGMVPLTSFQAVNSHQTQRDTIWTLSRGLKATNESRAYSQAHDKRIAAQDGSKWFWADTRIEQLDLHEVNGRYVGSRQEMRTNANVAEWRDALTILIDDRVGPGPIRVTDTRMEELHSSSGASQPEEHGMLASLRVAPDFDSSGDSVEHLVPTAVGGGVALAFAESSADDMQLDDQGQTTSNAQDEVNTAPNLTTMLRSEVIDLSESESDSNVQVASLSIEQAGHDVMEVDDNRSTQPQVASRPTEQRDVIVLDGSDESGVGNDSDDSVSNRLAGELAKNFRTGRDARMRDTR